MAHSAPLPEPLRLRLRSVVRRRGEAGAIRDLGISRSTLTRALAGLGLYSTSHIAIEARLGSLDPAPSGVVRR